jgi:hypothetical protein
MSHVFWSFSGQRYKNLRLNSRPVSMIAAARWQALDE